MDSPRESRIDPAMVEAIGALGNEQRLQILLALAETTNDHQDQWHAMSFTALYEAVDIGSTSQFSYHLSKLVGPFITETDDGYRLTYGGDKLVRGLRSGIYESTTGFEERTVAGTCVFCETDALVAALENELFVVRCTACESTLLTDSFPTSQERHRTPEEIIDSFGSRIWSSVVLLRGGVCPECYGPVDTAVDAHDHDHDHRTAYTHRSTCEGCRFVIHLPLEVVAAFHPAAIGFLWEHGISLFELTLWEMFAFIVNGQMRTRVRSLEPFDATVTLAVDGAGLELQFDETHSVSNVNPRSAPATDRQH
ncbi:ArsR/SmtB family transcription factor [Natronosalvus vescus]|uniref:ArsR/SmtB family transcription factor n=1 Tax=Natronosalvus vescus TaxID=2953881 RepID=UPI00209001FA|nr:winged helix-turn-helix domain-containing protein [Natronosalvus vescus]